MPVTVVMASQTCSGVASTSSSRSTSNALPMSGALLVCFFFQAEDGIRDVAVTGVQTCALPISLLDRAPAPARAAGGCGVRLRDLRRGHPAGDIRGTRLHDRSAGADGTVNTRTFVDRKSVV